MDRFFGKHSSIVVDVKDEGNSGLIKVRCPKIYGDSESPWCRPCSPFACDGYGIQMVPPVGEGVYIELEDGDPDKPIWVGGWWSAGKAPLKYNQLANAKVIMTKAGNYILFGDSTNDSSVTISDGNKNIILLSKDGTKLADPNGNTITITKDGVSIKDKNGSSVTTDSNGITLSDFSSNSVSMTKSGIAIKSKGNITFTNSGKVLFNEG